MLRKTEQAEAIRETLDQADHPLTPREILRHARRRVPTLGLATVYRALRRGKDAGWLHVVDLPGEPPRYEPSGRGHHHHFHCRECGRVTEVTECRIQTHPSLPPGFTVDGHEVVLFGRCDHCTQGRP